jgi:crotonobetaine/carnitine-CoA ligase
MVSNKTIRELLAARAQESPDAVFGFYGEKEITFRSLDARVNRLADGLIDLGITAGQRVAVVFGNHPDHIITLLALAKIRAVWVPVNTNLRGASLELIIEQAAPGTIMADAEYWPHLQPILAERATKTLVVRNPKSLPEMPAAIDFADVARGAAVLRQSQPAKIAAMEETRAIFFTSGTTGPPKGAPLTERMLITCANAAAVAADVQAGDVFLLWEPIYHTSGAQMCILALLKPAKLAIVSRFSASYFWDQIRKYGVTKLHYLGGVLDILLKQPRKSNDKHHKVALAFGAGCHEGTWKVFERRFGIKIREVYGMTETSCFTTLNRSGKVGSIGKPYPYFDIRILDESDQPVAAGDSGEIVLKEKVPGLIVQEYLGQPDGNESALQNGWFHTGDLARRDDEGDLFYLGRKKDSIRRRGENISAWEIERVLNTHPDIEESAAVGLDAEIGEEDVLVFIKSASGRVLDALDIIKWCEPKLPYFQIPRYIQFVDKFEKTPTQRIIKDSLAIDKQNCWDLEDSGYRIQGGG